VASDPYSLDQLHDIVEPVAISWWPPTTGFWLLLAIVLVWCLAMGLRSWIRYQRNAYRREALAQLDEIEHRIHASGSKDAALIAIAQLLKRVALTACPREKVAALTGVCWLTFLDKSGNTNRFTRGPAAAIGRACWQMSTDISLSAQELTEISTTARHWIVRHRNELEGAD
jgi:hypothetical protein